MKKPKTLNICGKKYDVQWNKVIREVNVTEDDNEVCYGRVHLNSNLITIWDNGRPDDSFSWMLHEVIHCLESELGFELSEVIVRLLETGLSDFLVRNGFLKE